MSEYLQLDDFTRYTFLSGIEHSPDGRYACFVTHKADLDENGYKSHLWLYDLTKGTHFQLTGLGKERSFIWLANSEEILFSAVRDPKDQERQKKGEPITIYYKIHIHGGEATEAFRIPLQVQAIKPLGNDRYLVTAAYDPKKPDFTTLSDQERADALKKLEEEKAYEILEEIPYWSNGGGFISRVRSRLYIFDANDGSVQALTNETLDVESVQLNEARTKAVFTGSDYTGMAPLENAIYLADLESLSVRRVTPHEEFTYSDPHFISDDTIICRGTGWENYGLNENPRFYLVNLADGTKKLLTPDLDGSTWSSVGSDCRYGRGRSSQVEGDHFYFVTTEGHSSFLNRMDFAGNIEKLTVEPGSVDSFSVNGDSILFIGLRGLALQELYSLKQMEERPITGLNTWVQKTKKLSQPEHLQFESAPGVTIDGWVLKPVDYEEGKRYPAILDIHGGPKTVYGTVFFHEMQYWANHGYFVFFCNPRGSDGKGNEFADLRGKYGTVDYEDLMKFTDLVLEKYPAIDPARVGVTGGSYGGFMTNWIIGQTNRFAAAASQRSISNWISMGYTTDIGYYFAKDQVGATPWSDPGKMWEHSPLKYADRVKTPTLFIHSEEDYRCWLPEALQMFTALKYHGVEARLCMFRGENHELSRSGKPKNRIKRLEEITNWFDRYLTEKPV
jgi:dipeptidyl aminopeptidase/acylaminoacyl peptidase